MIFNRPTYFRAKILCPPPQSWLSSYAYNWLCERHLLPSCSWLLYTLRINSAYTHGMLTADVISTWCIYISSNCRHQDPLLWSMFGCWSLQTERISSLVQALYSYSKRSSITLLSSLPNVPPHPAPQIRRVSRWHCALYKFTYLLTYLLSSYLRWFYSHRRSVLWRWRHFVCSTHYHFAMP